MGLALKLVSDQRYPRIKETARPVRFWDSEAKRYRPWRYYKTAEKAHIGALVEAWFHSDVGVTIEVVDVRTGKLIGQYTSRTTGVDWRLE